MPFIPENTGVWGQFGWSGIVRASGIIFFAYIGFDAVSTAAQEAKNPQRDVPIGILGSLIICTVLYVLMSAVLTGMLPYPKLNDAAPVATALEAHPQLLWLTIPVIVGALAGLTSVILVMMLAQSRIFYSMSRDGLLPPPFRACHPEWKTPGVLHRADRRRRRPDGRPAAARTCSASWCRSARCSRSSRSASASGAARDASRSCRDRSACSGVWFVGLGGMLFCGLMLASLFMTGGTWYRIVGWTIIGFADLLRLRLQAQRAAQWRRLQSPGKPTAGSARRPSSIIVARASP